MTRQEAFFALHRDLPREGPGLPEDVLWALDTAQTPENARILDAACGPGADTITLAEARPKARIDAIDLHAPFAKATRAVIERFSPRVQANTGDYSDLTGQYDLIWCAGAAYFKGIEAVLLGWRAHLVPGGAVAFSEPAWVGKTPGDTSRAFWEEYRAITDLPDLRARIDRAGWEVHGQRWIIGPAWAAYYEPMEARIADLGRDTSDPVLQGVLAEGAREIALWRAAPDEIAYMLFVVRPK